MKKNILLAMVLAALVSCSSDDFVGDQSLQGANESGAISFSGESSKITRATQNTGTVAQMLDGQFKVYGVKSGTTAGTDIQKVFVNYGVWSTTGVTTTSDSHHWEYVENSSTAQNHGTTDNPMSLINQTIKYWDHSAYDYRFVAGSPYQHFNFTIDASNNITSATVTGLSGHIDANSTSSATTTYPVYIADPLIITEPSYSTAYGAAPVTFTFKRQQSRVRVGIYETIPGYKITAIHFYANGSSTAETGTNIILTSGTADYFVGGSSSQVKATLNYTWTGDGAPKYTFAYGDVDDSDDNKKLKRAQNWYGGALTGVKAVTSNHTTVSEFYGTDGDMESTTGYFSVLPTQVSTAAPILIKCDYTLESEVDNSGETIKVTGATAAIPAAFSKWEPNTTYTYIFKISDNTNGSTGNNKVGLYPITFDAVATEDANGTAQGYITTVSTPSITTYQAGSVNTNGVQYTTANGAIYFTAQDDKTGVLHSLSALNNESAAVGMVQVYTVASGTTEADLILTRPTTTTTFTTSVGSATWTNNGQSVESGKWASFTPNAAGTYAIEYITATTPSTAYAYKIVVVE